MTLVLIDWDEAAEIAPAPPPPPPAPTEPAEPAARVEPPPQLPVVAAVDTPPQLELPPPPVGLGSKQRLRDDDYLRKVEGGYFTGLPLANFDRDTGFGLGARAYYYADGKRTDPLFAYTPYLQRVFLQAFASTGGVQFHWLDYDAPSFLGSLFRVRASATFAQNISQNYYGVGVRSMQPLSFPGSPESFGNSAEYDQKIRQVQPDGTTYAQYNNYFARRVAVQLSAERSLLGGVVRPLLGLGLAAVTLRDYSGDGVDAEDAQRNAVTANQARTRLSADCAANVVVGCGGGWDNVLRLGLSIDTRDFEPDPNHIF